MTDYPKRPDHRLRGGISRIYINLYKIILSLALRHECDILVLGAWGCGVFQNDPQTVAGIHTHLGPGGPFRNRFKLILFSILDTTSDERVIRFFRELFLSELNH